MPARLVPLTPGSAPVVPLQRPVLLVGRHPDCDVRLELPAVSRRHCCLALAYDRVTIRDLGSRHGTWVNGELRDESRLHPGDEVAIGPLLYRYEDDPPPPPAAKKAEKAEKPADPPAGKPAPAPAPFSLSELPIDPDGDLVPLSELFPHL